MSQFALPPSARSVLRWTDRQIDQAKPDNRGLVIESVREVLRISMEQWRITEDPRFLELALRAGDRLTKLLKLLDGEGPMEVEGLDTEELVDRVRRDLLALEARMDGA